jgi:integrase
VRLTDSTVAALKVPRGKSEIIAFDDDFPGFGVRVRSGGSRRFVFQYKLNGTNRRATFKEANVKRARAAAQILAAKVTLGSDPALEKESAHDAAGDTFKRCLDRYLARPQGRRRERTLMEIRRHLERNLAPLHRLHIKKIDRRRIADELARLTVENGAVQSNRTRASLSAFLNWCIGEGYLDVNIAAQTNKHEEVARSRVLEDRELRAIWHALPEQGDYRDLIRLLILTGQRLREIANLSWQREVDLDKAIITLPPERTKNHRPHVIPLSAPALEILKGRAREGRELVFGKGGTLGFSNFSKSKRALDERAKLKAPWVVHDIRRSVATGLAKLVQPHIVECVLGYVGGFRSGVASVYNQHAYEDEKRQALDLWGKHISGLVS